MTIEKAKLYKGHHSQAATASDPHEDMDYGSKPRVGQSEPYQSGSNAHNKHQRAAEHDQTAGDAAASGPIPSHNKGWPARSPSKPTS